jgi:hypothetical protein
MRLWALPLIAVLAVFSTPAWAEDARSDAKAQVEFGIRVAQSGLWKEATYRWERAVAIDPSYAAAWNNLAIGYEQEGRFDDAQKAYERRSNSIRRTCTSGRTTISSKKSMTARSAAAIVSLVVLCGASACTNFYEIPIETPIQPKLDVSAFQRILVVGFITGGTDDVDANLETVRLLRSQLRSKSNLRVIEAEVLPLAEIAAGQNKTASGDIPAVPQLPSEGQNGGQQPPPAQDVQDDAPRIRTEKDLEKFQSIFADVAFWKRIGEEYQNPLIVTGTVLFTPQQSQGFVVRNQEGWDNLGRRTTLPQRVWLERKGFVLSPKFIFIDGRTGATLHSETFREEVLYEARQNTPALSSYFELMDRLVPSFLGSLSTQRIRGTRVLLR